MGVELPLCVVVTILECCVTFSGVKLSIRSFVLFIHRGLFRFLHFHQTAFNPFYREELSMFSLISPDHQQMVFDSYVPVAVDEHSMMSHCQGNAKIGV